MAAISTIGASARGRRCIIRCRWTARLFSIGDPHISQGDGEIGGTAIEASLDVLFQIVLRSDFSFPSPLLETPECWIVHGFDEDLNVAMRNASLEMLALLTEHWACRDDAYSLMSVAADFAVTQVVDGRQGVHVRIPRQFSRRTSYRRRVRARPLQPRRYRSAARSSSTAR